MLMRRWSAIYVIGVICCLVLPRLLNVYESIAILALACICLGHRYSRGFGIFLLSICWFSVFAQWQLNWLNYSTDTEQEHSIIARINSLQTGENNRFFSADLIEFDRRHFFIGKSVTLYIPDVSTPIYAGQIVHGQAKIRPIWSMANPAGWDQQRYRFSQHLAYQLKLTQLQLIENQPSWRSRLFQTTVNHTQTMSQQGVFLALTFAHKKQLSMAIKQQMKSLGLAHLLVISGLHVSLVGASVYGLVSLLLQAIPWLARKPLPSKQLALLAAMLAVVAYGYLAGFTLPVRRACLLFCLASALLVYQRHMKAFDLWLWVLAVSLLIDPLAVLSGGFWLSFLAVLALILLAKSLPRFNWPKPWHWLKPLALFALLQLAFLFLLSPLQLGLFQGFSALSPIYNLIAIPCLSLVILPAILIKVVLLHTFPTLGLGLLPYLDALLQFSLSQMMSWPSAWVHVSQQVWWLWLAAYIAILLLGIVRLGPYRSSLQGWAHWPVFRVKPIAISLIFAITIMFIVKLSMLKARPPWQVQVFDVGQGLSVLVSVAEHHLLYDTGFARSEHYNAANLVVLPYLKRQGVAQLNHLVISHDDNDHAGGLKVITNNIEVATIWHSQPQGKQRFCGAGKSFQLGPAKAQFLTVKEFGVGKGRNNNSCILLLDFGQQRLLLPGDIERRAERELLRHFATEIRADILVSPHHGSNSSSSLAFIHAVSPSIVVHSASKYNAWGMPRKQVVARYQQAHAQQFNIANTGMLTIQPKGELLEVIRYRQDTSFRWYHMALLPFVP